MPRDSSLCGAPSISSGVASLFGSAGNAFGSSIFGSALSAQPEAKRMRADDNSNSEQQPEFSTFVADEHTHSPEASANEAEDDESNGMSGEDEGDDEHETEGNESDEGGFSDDEALDGQEDGDDENDGNNQDRLESDYGGEVIPSDPDVINADP